MKGCTSRGTPIPHRCWCEVCGDEMDDSHRTGQLEGAIEGAIREIECCIEAIEHPRPTWAAKTAREARQVIEKLKELINYDN